MQVSSRGGRQGRLDKIRGFHIETVQRLLSNHFTQNCQTLDPNKNYIFGRHILMADVAFLCRQETLATAAPQVLGEKFPTGMQISCHDFNCNTLATPTVTDSFSSVDGYLAWPRMF